MSIFDFVKNAGERLLGREVDVDAPTEPEIPNVPRATSESPAKAPAMTVSAGKLHMRLEELGLAPEDLSVSFREGVVEVNGTVSTPADRERIILALGNVEGVSQVVDALTLEGEAPEPTFYTVQPGDTLSKIAKQHYGDAMKYPMIFEANRPMLKDPDKIYPGQVLRIPDLGS